MAQTDGDGDGKSRRQWIIDRIAQIRAEFDDRAQELGGLIEELDRLEQPIVQKRHKRLPPGWEVFTGGGAIVALVAAWGRRHWRPVAAAAGAVAGSAVIAGALLAHGAPPPRHGATGPTPRPSATATASAPASLTPSARAPSSAPHKPGRTLPPPLVAVPSRGRRPGGVPSGAAPSPAGPSPTPTRPGLAPSATPSPPPPFTCPAGLILEVIGIGLYICV
jgi:hypothetical protein